ncbi:MAG: Queuine tRNA-ribosyltransferase [Parcubacteria group bacterium GW2011_GWA1_51_12]|nr:MAG: Queuine tRNA-ribosyltransferase [Parcubacteria group bacterium GW2011_GWA1_51_12]
MTFKIQVKDTKTRARVASLETSQGVIETPAFVTVGTLASVRTLTPDEIRAAGSQIVLANTYHLYLEGRHEVIQKAGGLAKFMSWNGPTMTDSGGFQVFSLGHGRGRKNGEKDYMPGDAPPDIDGDPREPRRFTITDEKVVFQSPRDGQTLELSPEISVQIQEDIGADIYFAFDECTDPVWPYEYQKEAVERTTRWAQRSLEAKTRGDQAIFGVIQGGDYLDLRELSARQIAALPFDGFGIGGRVDLSEKENIATVFHWTLAHLPKEKPVHALGLGSPKETIEAIAEGVDLFDCVSPTREARNGTIYTSRGRLHIENAPYREDFSPLEDGCGCYTCAHFTKSYLHHLFRAKELLAKRLATIHNLTFINNLVRQAREAIRAGAFPDFQRGFYEKKIY